MSQKMSSLKLPVDFKETFSKHLMLISFTGLNVLDDSNRKFLRMYWRFIVYNIASFALIVLCMVHIILEGAKKSLLDVVDNIPCLVIFIQDLIVGLVLASKKDRLKDLLYEIAALWTTSVGDNLAKKKTKTLWLRRLSTFNRTTFIASGVGAVVFVLLPYFMTAYNYTRGDAVFVHPYKLYYFNEQDSFFMYTLVFFMETVPGVYLQCFTHLGTVLLLAVLLCLVSLLLRLLHYDIENVLQTRDGKVVLDQELFRHIVRTHQKLTRLTNTINELFGTIIFISVAISSLILGLFLFLGLFIHKRYFSALLFCFIEIFNLTWPGQLLKDTSQSLADAIYNTQWYKADLRYRKMICIIILRSQRPLRIYVLGFTDLSLELFATVVSSAWSYLSILNSASSKNNN